MLTKDGLGAQSQQLPAATVASGKSCDAASSRLLVPTQTTLGAAPDTTRLVEVGCACTPSPPRSADGLPCHQYLVDGGASGGFYGANPVDLQGLDSAAAAAQLLRPDYSWQYTSLVHDAYTDNSVKSEPLDLPTAQAADSTTGNAGDMITLNSHATADVYADGQAANKCFFANGGALCSSLPAPYPASQNPLHYTTNLYGGGTAALTAQQYARAIQKSAAYMNPYLASAAPSGYYSAGYSAPPALDYSSYAAAYPQYYGAATAAYGAPTTTATYRLHAPAQLPPCTTLAGATDGAPQQLNVHDLLPFGKPESKRSKSKKKKQSNPSPSPDSQFERVFIWDLDETCIVLNSLLSGEFALRHEKDAHAAATLGMRMEELIVSLSEMNFSLSELEDCDQVHIDDVTADDPANDLTSYNFGDGFHLTTTPTAATLGCGLGAPMRGGVDWMRRLAYRYRRIRDVYGAYKDNVAGLIATTNGNVEQWVQVCAELDRLTDCWTSTAQRCLRAIQSRERYANVLVSSNHLVQSLVKLLLFGLGPTFPIENVYSASKVGREACFERIQTRFGKKCTFVVVGAGRDDEAAAKQMQFPFWRISAQSDLLALHYALDLKHL